VTGRREETEEKLFVSTNSGFLAKICLLNFIHAFEKWELFVLGTLVEDGAT
jgi:hypothetical protein